MTNNHVAVLDIGKTNVKVALFDLQNGSEILAVSRPNIVVEDPPWPHFDVEGHWQFFLDSLAEFHAKHRVDAISVTTHGASIALLDADGVLAAPILDYEHDLPADIAASYDDIRPPFHETGSPRLAMGLNVGAQLFWQFHVDPTLKDRSRTILTYPQYWTHRLTGIATTDVTSLGCHTDLWNPTEQTFSSLADRLGIVDKIAPPRRPTDVLGAILPEVASRTGLAETTPVVCGIHDSNASLLPYLLHKPAPFSVVSTGTWVIAMSIGGDRVSLQPEFDTLINVSALGTPVASARFMGGREYDVISEGRSCEPSDEDIASVLRNSIMLLPAVVPDAGPFPGKEAHWHGERPPAGTGAREAALGFYLALVTRRCLELIGHSGPVIVEGPFAKNRCYLMMLEAVTETDIEAVVSATGTSKGAAILFQKEKLSEVSSAPVQFSRQNQSAQQMKNYAKTWARLVN